MIGYYVHHQGRGHLQRARAIGRHLAEPPTMFSSIARPDQVDRWIALPMDNQSSPEDPTASGTLHWVPRHDRGLRRRMAIIAEWIDAAQPDLMVVDVSVEVAVLCRLMGIPTILMAMPGDRSDRAHRSAYDSAHAILAPWPAEFSTSQWSDRWSDKTFHVGAISRYAGRRPQPVNRDGGPVRVLVLWGNGGDGAPVEAVAAASRATPEYRWRIAGTGEAAGTPVWDQLTWADVVVTHGGQNAVAEVAAARRPAVVIAESRPHDEQLATVRTLDRAGLAVGLESFPEPSQWRSVLATAMRLGGEHWQRWAPADAAVLAADFLSRTARDVRQTVDETVA